MTKFIVLFREKNISSFPQVEPPETTDFFSKIVISQSWDDCLKWASNYARGENYLSRERQTGRIIEPFQMTLLDE